MLQLENQTPFKAAIAVLPDRSGIDTLYVIVKATVTLRPKLTLADVQVPLTLADEYDGDPATSSLRVGSDMHIGKSGTDVLLIGSAWAPASAPVPRMQVSMSVADRQKTIQVTGDRVWRDGRPSSPQPVRVDAARLGTGVWRRASARRAGVWRRSAIPSGADSPAGGRRMKWKASPYRISRIPPPCSSSSGRLRRRPAWRRSPLRGCRAARTPEPTTNGGSAPARRTFPTTSIHASFSARLPSSRSIAILQAENRCRWPA